MATYKQYDKEGTMYWQVRGYIGTDELTGKKKYAKRSGFETKKEARQAYEKARRDFELNGNRLVQAPKNITFIEVYHEWLVNIYQDTVKEGTLFKTKQHFELHVLPAFGDLRINKITANVIQKQVNEWHKQFKTYKRLYRHTMRVMDYALMQGYIEEDLRPKININKKALDYDAEHGEITFYTKEQLKTLLDYLKSTKGDNRWYCFFRLLAFTGMRRGEILALTWKDVNFKESTLNIDKSLAMIEGSKLISNSTKTESSERIITLDPITLKILKDWKHEQAKIMLGLGFNTLKPDQLLFSKYKDNSFLNLAAPYNRLKTITPLAGLPMISVHGFRHTHCSLLFDAGVSMKDVMNRLGHSDIQTTMNIYAHVTDEQEKKSAELFAEYVGF